MAHHSFTTLLLDEKDGILTITVNRPDKLNALNDKVLKEFKELLTGLQSDKTFKTKGVILTGAGDKAFIAGADIKGMSTMNPEQGAAFAALGQEVSMMFENLRIPVVAAVDGFALGGGCEMAMSCDFIYATKRAVFGQPEVNLGLIPGFGGTQRLIRYVGLAMAKELVFSGRNVKAEEALQIGLVQKLFENKEGLLAGAREILQLINSKSPLAVAQCKQIMHEGEVLPMPKRLQLEKDSFQFIFGSKDKQEGVAAFLEKRKPDFPGK